MCTGGSAGFRYFFVQRQLKKSESERSRYQQAIHWAAHEMRTPLTAIQGSSEIMTRYALPEAKRKQLSEMINSESKRLARMIQTFLDVERLAEGQMEMKREPFQASATSSTRVCSAWQPLAERKKIGIFLDTPVRRKSDGRPGIDGVRALQSVDQRREIFAGGYAKCMLRRNCAATNCGFRCAIRASAWTRKELKNIFKKFYRTKRAEASGEVGTGIGLSIVEQIVTHHGGRMEVDQRAGKRLMLYHDSVGFQGAVKPPSFGNSRNAETSDRRG